MIAETLLQALNAHFPNLEMQIGARPNPDIRIRAQHPDVGDISIWDDGDEVTLEIGDITHGHFAAYDVENMDKLAQEVTEQVIDFLELLFDDQVLLWKACSGGSGGWHILNPMQPFTYQLPTNIQSFLWSEPKPLEAILGRTSANKSASC